jgi:formylglycine-generating enzyme required for sulfatase activity
MNAHHPPTATNRGTTPLEPDVRDPEPVLPRLLTVLVAWTLQVGCLQHAEPKWDSGGTDPNSNPLPPFGGTGETVVGTTGIARIPFLPGGLRMGCTDGQIGCEDDEKPVQPVELTYSFELGATEVTQQQYLDLTGNQPSNFDGCGPTCPVEQVNWHMAANFANALSIAEGYPECYQCIGRGRDVVCERIDHPKECAGFRLPTEAEWEYAARCGTDTLFSGSNTIEQVAWANGNANRPHEVGTLAPTSCGTYDMTGNVFEWTEDGYRVDYQTERKTDRFSDRSEYDSKVVRGGAWTTGEPTSRVSYRNLKYPEERLNYVGLRVARTID